MIQDWNTKKGSFRPTVPENSGTSATCCSEVAFPSTECKELGESLASQDTGHFELTFPLVSDKGKMFKT